jgi:hypothetical protein
VLRWTLGITPEASTSRQFGDASKSCEYVSASQPAWHVTRMLDHLGGPKATGFCRHGQGHRHIAVLPDQVPPRRGTRARSSAVGLLLTRGMPSPNSDPLPSPIADSCAPFSPVWTVHVASHESVSDLQKSIYTTPLLAAEGFMILRIQIQRAKRDAISSAYGNIADLMGEFA